MRGDLLFYRVNPKNLVERLIGWATSGPFSHVAIDVGDGTIIEAQASGVRQVSFPDDQATRMLRFSPAGGNIEAGFLWLKNQLGARYGWLDLVDALLHRLRLSVFLGRSDEFDCSDLAACFAAISTNDPVLMNRVLDEREDISPNDLARYYHLI